MSPPMVAWNFPTDHAVAGRIVAGGLLIVCAVALVAGLRRRPARASARWGDRTNDHRPDGPAALEPAALEPAALEPAALEPAALEPAALDHAPLGHRPLDGCADLWSAPLAGLPTAGVAAVPEPPETPPPTTAATPTTTFLDRTAPTAVHPSAAIPPPAERRTAGAPGTVRTAGNGSRTTRFERGGRNRPGVTGRAVGPAATRS